MSEALEQRINAFLDAKLPSAQEFLEEAVKALHDPQVEGALLALREQITKGDMVGALKILDKVDDAVLLMRQRQADKSLVRIGHVLRNALTGEQFLAAMAKARVEHPEAWLDVLPTKDVAMAAAELLAKERKAAGIEPAKKKGSVKRV